MASKGLLSGILLLCVVVTAEAQFNYITNDNTIIITGYTGSGGAVTIPRSINGLAVTVIGNGAFMLVHLTSVMIPDSVTNISDYAFAYCDLVSITIPNRVTSIGDQAFDHCIGLISVAIPESVIRIGMGTFYCCASLTNVAIPNHVISIGPDAFYLCTNLSEVIIPNGVTNIGDAAWAYCSGLTNVNIGNGVTRIGDYAFDYCDKLEAITVDALNPAYSSLDGVVFNKTRTTLIRCPEHKAGSFTIPDGVMGIAAGAFANCSDLTRATMGNSVGIIGGHAFDSCASLHTVNIGDSVTNIGFFAFSSCASLTNLTIPNKVISIDEWAFNNCSSLTGLYFEGEAPHLGFAVFANDINATPYYLPGSAGWGPTFGGLSTALWLPQVLTSDPNFGLGTNGFGFTSTWASGMTVVVEATTNLTSPSWVPLATNTFTSDSFYFTDPQWRNYPSRFYRLRWQ